MVPLKGLNIYGLPCRIAVSPSPVWQLKLVTRAKLVSGYDVNLVEPFRRRLGAHRNAARTPGLR
jgi:hypothetical protein